MLLRGSIIERLMYKVVKRHIAGTTISSVIGKAKEFNSKGVPVSITFLSTKVDSIAKARYVSSTYIELLRRIAMFGLKASIEVPLEEIGYNISRSTACSYLENILKLGNKLGIFIWLELPEYQIDMSPFQNFKGVGYAGGLSTVSKLIGNYPVKIILPPNSSGRENSGSNKDGKKKKEELKRESEAIERLASISSGKHLVVHAPSEKLVGLLLKRQAYKKYLIFEFQLGYEKKWLATMSKKGWLTSVYLPFGKGWADYAVTRIQGHYTHLLASTLLEKAK